MKLFFSISVFLSFAFLSAYPQTPKGKVMVYVKPSYAIVRIDTLKITQFMTPIEFDTGRHTIKMWAPECTLYEMEFNLSANQTRLISRGLPHCKAYRKFQRELSFYYSKKYALRYVLPTLTMGYAINVLLKLKEMNRELSVSYNEAMASKERYDNSFWPQDIEEAKIQFASDKKNYDDQLKKINYYRNLSFIGIASASALSVLTWRISNKLVKPVYEEIPLLSQSEFNFSLSYNNLIIGYAYHF